eukprot:gene10357-biopygen3287
MARPAGLAHTVGGPAPGLPLSQYRAPAWKAGPCPAHPRCGKLTVACIFCGQATANPCRARAVHAWTHWMSSRQGQDAKIATVRSGGSQTVQFNPANCDKMQHFIIFKPSRRHKVVALARARGGVDPQTLSFVL